MATTGAVVSRRTRRVSPFGRTTRWTSPEPARASGAIEPGSVMTSVPSSVWGSGAVLRPDRSGHAAARVARGPVARSGTVEEPDRGVHPAHACLRARQISHGELVVGIVLDRAG